MKSSLPLVTAHLPKFIAQIGENFADINTHIMVVNGTSFWGSVACQGCKGTCDAGPPEYPCVSQSPGGLEACDTISGAGDTFPVGWDTANKRCKVGGNRYIVNNTPNEAETFLCLANVGADGGSAQLIMKELRAALSEEHNAPGGCNAAFLRPDALLVLVVIADGGDDYSKGTVAEWKAEVAARKGGDAGRVVLLVMATDIDLEDHLCLPFEEQGPYKLKLREWVEVMPNAVRGSICAPDWSPFLDLTVEMVLDQCEVFVPQ